MRTEQFAVRFLRRQQSGFRIRSGSIHSRIHSCRGVIHSGKNKVYYGN